MDTHAVQRWRKRAKEVVIVGLGGKCMVCGYSKCLAALDAHHLGETKKTQTISSMLATPVKIEKIIEEAKKCVLLCANCHREFHVGEISLPAEIPDEFRWSDERVYLAFPSKFRPTSDVCPVCGGEKVIGHKTCSLTCAGKLKRHVDWESVDLPKLMSEKSMSEIGRTLGLTAAGVRKRAVKLGLV